MTNDTTLRIERVLDATPEALFRGWTNREAMEVWYRDRPDDVQWADTTVTITLEEDDGKTRLVLVHEGFPSTELRDGAAGGWPGFIERLERAVSGS